MSSPRLPSRFQTIGERIRWLIESHLGLNQAEFARRLGVTRQLLSRWINNPDRPPGDESLRTIAQLAGVPEAWLRYGRGLETAQDGEPDLKARLEEIERGEISEGLKAWMIGEMAAALRAQALANVSTAMPAEALPDMAASLRHEGRAAELRAAAALVQQANPFEGPEGEARLRALIEEAARTHRIPLELIRGKERPLAEGTPLPEPLEED